MYFYHRLHLNFWLMSLKPMVMAMLIAFSSTAFSQCANDSLQLYPSGDFNYQGTGFGDGSESPCAISGAYSEIVIPFKTYSGGTRALTLADSSTVPVSRVYAVRIDGVSGLPSGLCWAVRAPGRIVSGDGTGLLIIKGTTSAAAGIFPVDVMISIDTQGNGSFGYTGLHPDNYKAVLGQPVIKVADANGNCPSAN